MNLKTVQIENYRSVQNISFEIEKLADETFTYGLIGVNEAGKSTILKALALKDGLKNEKGETLPLLKDFKDKTRPIIISYSYILNKSEIVEFENKLVEQLPGIEMSTIDLSEVTVDVFFPSENPNQPSYSVQFVNLTGEDEEKELVSEQLQSVILEHMHKSIFWTAEDRFLISLPINLSEFAQSPENFSIPLKNCFFLAGIPNIQERIASLAGDSTEVEQLQTELGSKVTEHINTVWPKHPIEITFLITDGLIHFHIKDLDTKGKAKTADQRSDGFRQFVSFLLTISAQNKNEELANTILLLDEPETHLHPQAQEDLLRELIKITQNNRNNIAFFATHSNYMIDKNDLSRNYKIFKESDKKIKNERTQKKQFDKVISTYASTTYEVFDIPSTDYHNELYSKLHEGYQDDDISDSSRSGVLNFDTEFLFKRKGLKKDKPWKKQLNSSTLPTYIRNCIHHPDNGNTYKEDELRKSIEILRSFF